MFCLAREEKTPAHYMAAGRQEIEINQKNAVAFSGKRNIWSNTVSNWTLAWLFHLTDSRIDLERIWQKQAVGGPILAVLESMSGIVNEHIRNTQQNVTEYCKREECWDKLKARDFELPGSIRAEYISEISYGKYDPTISIENKVVEFC